MVMVASAWMDSKSWAVSALALIWATKSISWGHLSVMGGGGEGCAEGGCVWRENECIYMMNRSHISCL